MENRIKRGKRWFLGNKYPVEIEYGPRFWLLNGIIAGSGAVGTVQGLKAAGIPWAELRAKGMSHPNLSMKGYGAGIAGMAIAAYSAMYLSYFAVGFREEKKLQ